AKVIKAANRRGARRKRDTIGNVFLLPLMDSCKGNKGGKPARGRKEARYHRKRVFASACGFLKG
ncbi:hypothetical protein Csa_016978, partial [Cucumis sativus]